MKYLYWNN